MKQIRIQKKAPRSRRDRNEVLALDARDPDVVRAKQGGIRYARDARNRRAA
jgi:hypothetical protein